MKALLFGYLIALAVFMLPDALRAEGRFALVVGNAKYEHVTPLDNAARDAELIARTLDGIGFEVTLLTELSQEAFWLELANFRDRIEGAELAVFYFAGHAFQFGGANYLLPVDADIRSVESIPGATWRLDRILDLIYDRERLERQTVLFIDACRNNPLPEALRTRTGTGLAKIVNGDAFYAAFATMPGAVAFDGPKGGHGYFAQALADHLPAVGISLSDLRSRVANQVSDATERHQIPFGQDSLRAQISFVPDYERGSELDDVMLASLAGLAPAQASLILERFERNEAKRRKILQRVAALRQQVTAVAREEIEAETLVMLTEEPVKEKTSVAAQDRQERTTISSLVAPETKRRASVRPQPLAPGLVTPRPGQVVETQRAGGNAQVVLPTQVTRPKAATGVAGTVRQGAQPKSAGRVSATVLRPVTRKATTVVGVEVAGATSKPEPEAPALVASVSAKSDDRVEVMRRSEAAEVTSGADMAKALVIPDDLVRATQRELSRLGCYRSRIDGAWGPQSRRAMLRFYLALEQVPESYEPDLANFTRLRLHRDVACKYTQTVRANIKAAPSTLKPEAAPKKSSARRNTIKSSKQEVRKSAGGSKGTRRRILGVGSGTMR